jgi:hypothetical protein
MERGFFARQGGEKRYTGVCRLTTTNCCGKYTAGIYKIRIDTALVLAFAAEYAPLAAGVFLCYGREIVISPAGNCIF